MKDEHQENIDFVKSRFPNAEEKGGDWCQNVYVSVMKAALIIILLILSHIEW